MTLTEFWRQNRTLVLALPTLALASGLAVSGVVAVSAPEPASDTVAAVNVTSGAPPVASAHSHGGTTQPAATAADTTAPGTAPGTVEATFFAAALSGANVVAAPDAPPVGDLQGRGRALIRIRGGQVCFTVNWSGTQAPTAAHLHTGEAGVNGPVRITLFASPLPASLHTVSGCVTADDEILRRVNANAAGYYVNLHTAEFGGGAVRGQLQRQERPVDLNGFLRGRAVAVADAGQEVPLLGDPDGRATGFARAWGECVAFAATWSGINGPTKGHLHQGPVGVAGGVAVDLFAAEGALPASITGVAGQVEGVRAPVVAGLSQRPQDFYLNLHTADFAKGAVRGQFFRPATG